MIADRAHLLYILLRIPDAWRQLVSGSLFLFKTKQKVSLYFTYWRPISGIIYKVYIREIVWKQIHGVILCKFYCSLIVLPMYISCAISYKVFHGYRMQILKERNIHLIAEMLSKKKTFCKLGIN